MSRTQGPKGETGATGPQGPQGPQGESALVWLAEEQVARLIKAKSVPRWWSYALTVGLALLLAGAAVMGVNAYRTQQLARTVQQGAISQCQSGNLARATNVRVWDEFLTIAVDNPEIAKTRESLDNEIASLGLPADVRQGLDDIITASWTTHPGDVKLVQAFEAYIASHERPVDCAKEYQN